MAGIVHRYHHLVEEDTVKGYMLSVKNHWSNTPMKNCMLAFGLGMLILGRLQTLSGQSFNGEPKGVTVCLWKNRSSLVCASMHLGLSTKLVVTI